MAKRNNPETAFAVIGLGVFGQQLCATLSDLGREVIAVDNDPALIERVKENVTQAILVNAADEASLDQVPLDDVAVAIVAMGEDFEASVMITAILKKMAVPHVIARATGTLHAQVLRQVGADEVVNIEIEAGSRLGARLAAPRVLEQVALSSDISVAEMYPPESLVGKSLAQLDLRNRFSISVISIKRTRTDVDDLGNPVRTDEIVFPGPADVLRLDDVIHIVGKNDSIQSFQNL